MNYEAPMRIVYDLQHISRHLFDCFAQASELYLFGSRRHRTRSERFDIDLILKHKEFIKPSMIREFIKRNWCQFILLSRIGINQKERNWHQFILLGQEK